MSRTMRGFGALALMLAATAADAQRVPDVVALVRDGRLGEISGMAASPQTTGRFWVHNDSGSPADAFAIDTTGRVQAQLRVTGVKPVDWEDMAAFALDGRSWLLLADTGDNGGVRKRVELVVVEEPVIAADAHELSLKTAPAWRIAFRYADEPHDVEAVGIDVPGETVLLLTKRTTPLQIWSLPLRPGKDAETIATPVGTLQPADELLPTVDFERRLMPGRPTALSISRDARRAAVLTYNSVWIYDRAAGESWAHAFARRPRAFPIALLAQAEAIAFGADNDTVYVTGERWPVPLLKFDVRP
ncbi:MAG TPA: hypothetical protein VLF18_15715 [Tahibacter sp.]|uniref:hypothetical protein n=1 Tax=Tahibacter sp. TaxID=2056211 RepID=UPI002C201480|nr:hypothetical protein [Tahibacter sp.]HSX61648.1 hypothetical protein [Tahibacter sp.]